MQKSILTKYQVRIPKKVINYDGIKCLMLVTVRYDDNCGNGHNTFSITGKIRGLNTTNIICCGCLHEEIARYFPELAYLIKWHLCGNNGPLYYIENTLYWAKKCDFDNAKKSAIWQDATDEQLSLPDEELKKLLLKRLPSLMADFKKDIEKLGFIY